MNPKLQDVASRRSFLKASAISMTTGPLIGAAVESRLPINVFKSGEFPIKVISSGNGLEATKNEKGEPAFGLQFYLIRKDGLHAGVTMRGKGKFSITDKDGTRKEDLVSLYR